LIEEQPSAELYDFVIIGAGTTGIYAAVNILCKMRCRVVLLEGDPDSGGLLRTTYPDKTINNYPGFGVVTADKLRRSFEQHLHEVFDGEIRYGQIVSSLRRTDDGLIEVLTTDGTRIQCFSVIIATGIGFPQPRRLELPNASEFESKGLEYYGSFNLSRLQGKEICVLGGGQTSFEFAEACADAGLRTTVVHRSDQFRCSDLLVESCRLKQVQIRCFCVAYRLEQIDQRLRLTLLDTRTKQLETIDTDLINVTQGMITRTNTFGLELDESRKLKVDSNMQTSMEHVYACGEAVKQRYQIKTIVYNLFTALVATNEAMEELKKVRTVETIKQNVL